MNLLVEDCTRESVIWPTWHLRDSPAYKWWHPVDPSTNLCESIPQDCYTFRIGDCIAILKYEKIRESYTGGGAHPRGGGNGVDLPFPKKPKRGNGEKFHYVPPPKKKKHGLDLRLQRYRKFYRVAWWRKMPNEDDHIDIPPLLWILSVRSTSRNRRGGSLGSNHKTLLRLYILFEPWLSDFHGIKHDLTG